PLRAFARMIPLRLNQRARCVASAAEPAPPPTVCRRAECGDCQLVQRVTGVKAPSLADVLATVDLAIEQPNQWQRRYPTAYSLHRTLLDLVSSPIGFPLFDVRDYEASEVDWAFDYLEKKFLGPAADANEGASYFLVPFFYGS